MDKLIIPSVRKMDQDKTLSEQELIDIKIKKSTRKISDTIQNEAECFKMIRTKEPSYIPPFYLKQRGQMYYAEKPRPDANQKKMNELSYYVDHIEGVKIETSNKTEFLSMLEYKLIQANNTELKNDQITVFRRSDHIETSNSRHIKLDLSTTDYFSTVAYELQKSTNKAIAILALTIDTVEMLNWVYFSAAENMMNVLEQKLIKYRSMCISSRIALYRKTDQNENRQAAITDMQNVVNEIRDIWMEIKNLPLIEQARKSKQPKKTAEKAKPALYNENNQDQLNDEVNEKADEYVVIMDEKETAMAFPSELGKKLVIKKFINIDGLEDFYIELEPVEQKTDITTKTKIKHHMYFRIYIDEMMVLQTAAFEVQKLIECLSTINVYLVKESQRLKIALYKKGTFFGSLIDEVEIDLQKMFKINIDNVVEVLEFKAKRKTMTNSETDRVEIMDVRARVPIKFKLNYPRKRYQEKKTGENFIELHKSMYQTIKNVDKENIDQNPNQSCKLDKKQSLAVKKIRLNQRLWFIHQKLRYNNFIDNFRIPLDCDFLERNKGYYLDVFNKLKDIKKKKQTEYETNRFVSPNYNENLKNVWESLLEQSDIDKLIDVEDNCNHYYYCQQMERKNDLKTLNQYVHEFYFRDRNTSFLAIFRNLFRQRRKLRPNIEEPKKIHLKQENTTIKLVANITKGSNVLVRKYYKNNINQLQTEKIVNLPELAGSNINQTNSFIKISFEDTNIKTESQTDNTTYDNNYLKVMNSEMVSGSDPTWHFYTENEVTLTYKEDYSGLGYLNLTLFDYCPSTQQKQINNKITYFLEKRYLSSIKIPLLPLLETGKVNGSFDLITPMLFFGYVSSEGQNDINNDDHIYEYLNNPNQPVSIDLRLNIEPLLKIDKKDYTTSKLINDMITNFKKGHEDQEIINKLVCWLRFFDRNNKYVKYLFGDNTENQSILLYKFLNDNTDNSYLPSSFTTEDPHVLQKLAYYVSLIPEPQDKNSNLRLIKNCQEVLESRVATMEEKAYLLANYFIHIYKLLEIKQNHNDINTQIKDNNENQEKPLVIETNPKTQPVIVFILYAYDIMNQLIVMVGIKHHASIELWNPLTAECYYIREEQLKSNFLGLLGSSSFKKNLIVASNGVFVKIKEVIQIVTIDDILIYKGVARDLNSIDWDFSSKKLWDSFKTFVDTKANKPQPKKELKDGKSVENKELIHGETINNGSIQLSSLVYSDTIPSMITKYEQELREYIRRKIEKERIETQKIELTENFHRPFQTRWSLKITEKIKHNLTSRLETYKLTVKNSAELSFDEQDYKFKLLEEVKTAKYDILNDIDKNKSIYGFYLNFKIQDYDSIWKAIKDTQFYDIYNDSVEFIMHVSVFPYSNSFSSIWVFLGYLHELDA